MLQVEKNHGIALITLDRAEKRNAFNPELVQSITKAIKSLNREEDIRVILIKGNGPAFSAGADLSYIQTLRDNTLEENEKDSMALVEMFEAIYHSPKLTISAVNGHALAGGCGLAMITDLCYAGVDASFGFTEVRIGFIPAIVTVYLAKKLSISAVRELMLTARIIDSYEAHRLGMVNQIFEEDFDQSVESLVQKIASNTSGQAIELTKELIRETIEKDHSSALQFAARLNAKARSTADCIKGMDAFLNKEKISWT